MLDLEAEIGRALTLGRRRGSLSTDEIAALLPLDRMTPEEIAEVVLRLEDGGVEVDLDPAFLRPRSDRPERPLASALPLEPLTMRGGRSRAASVPPLAPPPVPAAPPNLVGKRWVTSAVLAIIVILCLVVALGVAFA
jgi:sigma-70-like protein